MLTLEYLAELFARRREAYDAEPAPVAIPGTDLVLGAGPAIMGVINLSPDSWRRESVCLSPKAAIRRGLVLQAQGADLIDIGAESTLANAARADASLQESRLRPVVEELADRGAVVSVETYLPQTARVALRAGARLINLTGIRHADAIFEAAAEADAALILCYVEGPDVRAVGEFELGSDPVDRMLAYFEQWIERARRRGLDRLLVDPGLGFYYPNLQDSAARVSCQIRMFLETFRLRALGMPVCHALPHAFEYFGEEVRAAEAFFAVLAALGKTDLFRTHEAAKARAVLETLSAFSPSVS